MSNCSISSISRILSAATTSIQYGPESDGNEGLLRISQSSRTGNSPTEGLRPYPEHLLEESYPSAKMQLVHSTAPAYNGWYAIKTNQTKSYIFNIYVQIGIGIK